MNRSNLFLLLILIVGSLALLIATVIPDIEAGDDPMAPWQPSELATATPSPSATESWFDDLPTPSYSTPTALPSETPTP